MAYVSCVTRHVRAIVAVAIASLGPPAAQAHFMLTSPPSWRLLNSYGDPQKVGPCGDEGTAPASGIVTPFTAGETISITLDETIFHPGHYRVALALTDRSELPPEPPVTPGDTPCGSAPIMDPPVFPVLVDGALVHTEPFTGSQTIQVTLPSDVTCTQCTLQILEFMSDHAAPCFYHHCADISITPTTGCWNDVECIDADGCTVDRCDDGFCVHPRVALADVSAGFLGSLGGPACASEQVPRSIGKSFEKAGRLVRRAAATPERATRFLGRAANRLSRATHRVGTLRPERVSSACAAALVDAVAHAQSLVECLRSVE